MVQRRRPGYGSIVSFVGKLRHWREELHPRDPRTGEFIDAPDWYVPPRTTQRGNSTTWHKAQTVRGWADNKPWTKLDRADFTDEIPHSNHWGDPSTYTGDGSVFARPAKIGGTQYLLDPVQPDGTYVRIDERGRVYVSPSFFNLSEDEQRFAFYRAAGDSIHVNWNELYPNGSWRNIFAEGITSDELLRMGSGLGQFMPDDDRVLWAETGIDIDLGPGPLASDLMTDEFQAVKFLARVEEIRNGEAKDPLILDENGAIAPGQEFYLAAMREALGPGVYRDLSAYLPIYPDPDIKNDLNGYTQSGDVAAEAYAMLAAGEADYLDEHFPGMAPLLRREAVAIGLPIDDGEIATPRHGDDRFVYGKEPFIPEEPGDLDSYESADDYFDDRRAWKDEIVSLLSRGEIEPEDADVLIPLPGNGVESWHPLPPTLYHVGTAVPAILEGGFKTRAQLGIQGRGLGAGPDDLVSFTDDPEIAENIYSAIMEARAFASGEITLSDLLEMDADDAWGIGASRVATDMLRGYYGADGWSPGDPYPPKIADLLDGPSDDAWSVFQSFLAYRSRAGGPDDPLFMSTDWEALGKVDPADIGIIEVSPDTNAWGHTVSALGEWRVHPAAMPTTFERVWRPGIEDERISPRRTLYRGLDAGLHDEESMQALVDDPAGWLIKNQVLQGALGEHWSHRFQSAWNFSQRRDVDGWGMEDSYFPDEHDGPFQVGIVLQADVPQSSILQPGTREWDDVASTEGIFDPDHPEAEVTVERGNPVSVTDIAITVTNVETGETTEEWVNIGELLATGFEPPATGMSAASMDLDDPDGDVTRPALKYLAELPAEQHGALQIALGGDLDSLSRLDPDELAPVLDLILDPATSEAALRAAGFDEPRGQEWGTGDDPGLQDSMLAAALYAQSRNFVVTDKVLAYKIPDDDRFLVHTPSRDAVTAGTPTVLEALERTTFPDRDLRGEESWGMIDRARAPEKALLLMAHQLDPESAALQYLIGSTFHIDPTGDAPAGHRIVDRGEAAAKFASIIDDPDVLEEVVTTYDDLVGRFFANGRGMGFSDIRPMGDGMMGEQAITLNPAWRRDLTAYVTTAGSAYFNPEHFTPEELDRMREMGFSVGHRSAGGLVVHEFAHALFAGQNHRFDELTAAGEALRAANAAAGPYVPLEEVPFAPGVTEADLGEGNVIRAAGRLSDYAGTDPTEAWAELFTLYVTDPDAPEWVQVWGSTFEATWTDVLSNLEQEPDLHPSEQIVGLNYSSGGVTEALNPGQWPILPEYDLVLQSALSSARSSSDSGGVEDDDAMDMGAEALNDYMFGHMRDYPDVGNKIDEWGASWDWETEDEWRLVTGDGESIASIESGILNIHPEMVDRDLLEYLVASFVLVNPDDNLPQVYSHYHAYGSTTLPEAIGTKFPPPPLVGKDEVGRFIQNLHFQFPEGMQEEAFEEITAWGKWLYDRPDAEIIGLADAIDHPDAPEAGASRIREAMANQLNQRPFLHPMNLQLDESVRRQVSKARRDAMDRLKIPERKKTLREMRQEKLERTYGEYFAGQVREQMDQTSLPLVQAPDYARRAGYSDLREWVESTEEGQDWRDAIEGHFYGFNHDVDLGDEFGGGERQVSVGDVAIDVASDFVTVQVNFYAYPPGDIIGESTRHFYPDSRVVDHALLGIDDTRFHGKGIGYAWNRRNDAWYLANGLTNVTVHAASSKGGYEWASDFFDMSSSEKQRAVTSIERSARRILDGSTPADAKMVASAAQVLLDLDGVDAYDLSAWEVAHLGWTPDTAVNRDWVARQEMMGTSWGGSKHLDNLLIDAGVTDLPIPSRGDPLPNDPTAESWDDFWQSFERYEYQMADYHWLSSTADQMLGVRNQVDVTELDEGGMRDLGVTFDGSGATATVTALEDATVIADASLLHPSEAGTLTALVALRLMGEGDETGQGLILTDDPDEAVDQARRLLNTLGSNRPGYLRDVDLDVGDTFIRISDSGDGAEPSDGYPLDPEDALDIAYSAFRSTPMNELFDYGHLGNPRVGLMPGPIQVDISDGGYRWIREDRGVPLATATPAGSARIVEFTDDITYGEGGAIIWALTQSHQMPVAFRGRAARMAREMGYGNGKGTSHSSARSALVNRPGEDYPDVVAMPGGPTTPRQHTAMIRLGLPPTDGIGDVRYVATNGTPLTASAPMVRVEPMSDITDDGLQLNMSVTGTSEDLDWDAMVTRVAQGIQDMVRDRGDSAHLNGWGSIKIDAPILSEPELVELRAAIEERLAAAEANRTRNFVGAPDSRWRRLDAETVSEAMSIDGTAITMDLTKLVPEKGAWWVDLFDDGPSRNPIRDARISFAAWRTMSHPEDEESLLLNRYEPRVLRRHLDRPDELLYEIRQTDPPLDVETTVAQRMYEWAYSYNRQITDDAAPRLRRIVYDSRSPSAALDLAERLRDLGLDAYPDEGGDPYHIRISIPRGEA